MANANRVVRITNRHWETLERITVFIFNPLGVYVLVDGVKLSASVPPRKPEKPSCP